MRSIPQQDWPIVEAAVDQALDRAGKIGVGTDIGRVLAAKLQRQARERARSGPFDGAAAFHRSGEGGVIHKA
jgi:hypothetical protein